MALSAIKHRSARHGTCSRAMRWWQPTEWLWVRRVALKRLCWCEGPGWPYIIIPFNKFLNVRAAVVVTDLVV